MRVMLHNNLKVRKDPGKKFSDHYLMMAGVYSDNDPGGIPEILVKEVEMERPTVTVLDGMKPGDFLESRKVLAEPDGSVHTMDDGEGDTRLVEELKNEPEKASPSPNKSSSRRRRRKS